MHFAFDDTVDGSGDTSMDATEAVAKVAPDGAGSVTLLGDP